MRLLCTLIFVSCALTLEAQPPAKFRLERLPVTEDAELVTVFGESPAENGPAGEVPLVSLLREKVSDGAGGRFGLIRAVWELTYTRPTIKQRLAADVPYLRLRAGSRRAAGAPPPPPILRPAARRLPAWWRFGLAALRHAGPVELDPLAASWRARSTNLDDYRQAHLARAEEVLALFEAQAAEPQLPEMRRLQARLRLAGRPLGGFVAEADLEAAHEKQRVRTLSTRGHHWELLRQRAEAEGLYFEPLLLPDHRAAAALLWVAEPDLRRSRRFNARFLNIADPYHDERLRRWTGYRETRWLDEESRVVEPGHPGAKAVTLIPLAVYGLDSPRVPALLVDFRRPQPGRHEAFKRLLNDLPRRLSPVTPWGSLAVQIGQTAFEFIARRRGSDVSPSDRLKSAGGLKLLLSLDTQLQPKLRDELARRLARAALNPLENDWEAETALAKQQYQSLIAAARRPDGLAARLDYERRAEMVDLVHGSAVRRLLRTAHWLSLGRYTHREQSTPERLAELKRRRASVAAELRSSHY